MKNIIPIFLFGLLPIVFSCSTTEIKIPKDNSTTLSLSDTTMKASCVYLTQDTNNIPVISWVEIDTAKKNKHFYFAKWNKKEDKFGDKKSIPIPSNASIHEEGMPKIAFKGDGTMLAFFETSTPAKGQRWGIGDIQMIYSNDDGKNWSKPTSIYPNKPHDFSISFSGISDLADGEIGITCLGTNDSTKSGRPVLFIKTQKNSFVAPVVVNPNACECCRTAIGSSSDGRISIAYRDLEQGNVRDISVTTSIDGGMLFTHNRDFSNDDWVIDGCPHNGPSIATNGRNNFVAWSTGGKNAGVHFAKLKLSGAIIYQKYISKDGQFIQLSLLPNGTVITAYNQNYMDSSGGKMAYYSRIVLNKINDTTFNQLIISANQKSSSYPVIVPLNKNNVIVAWRNDDFTIHYRRININSITQKAKEEKELIEGEQKSQAIEMVADLVCGMQFDKKYVKDSVEYQGKEYSFCSSHCKHEFLENPEKYAFHE